MKQDFRTSLNKARGLGSAKDGTEHFWHQRLTAFANVRDKKIARSDIN